MTFVLQTFVLTTFVLHDVCPPRRLSYKSKKRDVCPTRRLSYTTFVLSDVCPTRVKSTTFVLCDICPTRRLSYNKHKITFVLQDFLCEVCPTMKLWNLFHTSFKSSYNKWKILLPFIDKFALSICCWKFFRFNSYCRGDVYIIDKW